MLALQVELLGGRYIATAYNDRDHAEWPPHPARLFSALVDTWANGEPGSGDGEQERMALIWMERQAPPSISASGTAQVAHRSHATVFVPVNDIAVIRDPETARAKLEEGLLAISRGDEKEAAKASKNLDKLRQKLVDDTIKVTAVPAKISDADLVAADKLLPEHRTRQARSFPSVTPDHAVMVFCWQADPEPELRAALARLVSRMVRLGHSSSLVCARLIDEPCAPTFSPDRDGEFTLRGVGPGQLDRLIAAHHQHQGVESRVLPCTFVRYREGGPWARGERASSVFADEWMIFAREDGPRLPSTSAVGVAHQFRRALLAAANDPMSTVLSGHRDDGAAADSAHLAVVPLPDVTSKYAHGGILGIALVLPRGISEADRSTLMRAVGRLEADHRELSEIDEDGASLALKLGAAGILKLRRVVWGEHKSRGLQARTWCTPSRTWATATPIALDKNPGDLHHPDAAKRAHAFAAATEIVAAAIERLGLPAPLELHVVRSCVLPGTAKPQGFPRFPIATDRPQRVLVHARIVFDTAVRGPILLGAGRYFGLGLCRPLDGRGGEQ